jgi:site-specific recombinase XerC
MDPIHIKPRDARRLILFRPYFSERVAMIKAIVGRRWHQQEKHWAVPHTNGTIMHLLEADYLFAVPDTAQTGDIRTVQELLGHRDVKTTMIYAHVLNRGAAGVRSPLDGM